MYLDITTMYPRLLRTNFWAHTLQCTVASMYVRRPSHHLCSWLQSITCRQSARHFSRHVVRCQDRGADCAFNCC